MMALFSPVCCAQHEEFFVTYNAPVIVGGGIARHFADTDSGRLSVRYSFTGFEGDTALIERSSVSHPDGPETKEIIRVPLEGRASKKTGRLEIDGHSFKLRKNADGRLLVREIKG